MGAEAIPEGQAAGNRDLSDHLSRSRPSLRGRSEHPPYWHTGFRTTPDHVALRRDDGMGRRIIGAGSRLPIVRMDGPKPSRFRVEDAKGRAAAVTAECGASPAKGSEGEASMRSY